MKVRVWVEKEVEAELSIEEMMAEIGTIAKPEAVREVLAVLSRLHAVLRNVPDDLLREMNDKQRQIITEALQGQINRINGVTA
jgi:hypothetical protein